MEEYSAMAQGKVIRAPSLKRGKAEERITDRVSVLNFLSLYFLYSHYRL